MSALDKSWIVLKNTVTDMYEYPKGSGNFVSFEQLPQGSIEQIEARNAKARQNLQNATQTPMQTPNPNPQNIMVNSKTGNYDPNNPEGWHPMKQGQR